MTRRQTRIFFVAGTAIFALIFIALTIDSHMKFGELTHADAITPAVIEGKHVWHRKNCINCHTLLGEGAYYAPDLTKIAQHRGEAYLRQFLRDPSKYYSEERHGRLMPNPDLSDDQISAVIAFLTWVSNIDNQNWPPRPILVTAASPQGIVLGTPAPGAASADPVALGEAVFKRTPPACFGCHALQQGVTLVGPSLAGLVTRANAVLGSPDYMIRGGDTVWLDGPLTLAARAGAICYLDEIIEARTDTIVVIHPLTDDRRLLPLDKTGEIVEAAPGFQLVISYNPGYQHALKDLKPSTRQRFVALEFDFPTPDVEADIVANEGGVERNRAVALVTLTNRLRQLGDRGLAEVPSTRLIVATARLLANGIPMRTACRTALLGPLTDDPDLLAAMHDLVTATM
jgi:nitric oxide reductase subunit C